MLIKILFNFFNDYKINILFISYPVLKKFCVGIADAFCCGILNGFGTEC